MNKKEKDAEAPKSCHLQTTEPQMTGNHKKHSDRTNDIEFRVFSQNHKYPHKTGMNMEFRPCCLEEGTNI